MRAFDYVEPQSVEEAVQILAEAGPGARLLAGGTDLLVQLDGGKIQAEKVIFLGNLSELKDLTWNPESGLSVGAGVTLRQIETDSDVRSRYPALAQSSAEIGSLQIRNLATLAGNVCNASPSADTSPALLAYDATVEILGPNGARTIGLEEFWTGPGATSLAEGELVVAIHLPAAAANRAVFYRKLSVRRAMDLAMVGVCVAADRNNGDVSNTRIALGAVGPVCLRATEAEALINSGANDANIVAAARLAEAASSPIDDQRASAAYRRAMVRVLVERGLRQILA